MPLLLAADTAVSPVFQFLGNHLLQLVLSVVGTVLLPAVKRFFEARTAESNVSRVISVFVEAATSAVAIVDRDLKPKLLAALADGILTDTEKAELHTAAMAILKSSVAPELYEQAKVHFGPMLESWMKGLIERAVTDRQATKALATRAAEARTAAADAITSLADTLAIPKPLGAQ